jgi:K+-sensing histidine kinase KdpD
MGTDRLLLRHRGLVLTAAVTTPLLLCGLLSLTTIEHTTAALLLVLLVVGAASTGLRAAGLLAALSGALGFDFFLTAPYLTLRILAPADIELAIGLLLVGVAVTELALWGRRQQARASEQSGYLTGVLEAAARVAAGSAPTAVIEYVERQLVDVLDLDVARFHTDLDDELPRLDADGQVRARERSLDVDHAGLPTDTELSLPLRVGDRSFGEFRLTAATHVARPTGEQRRLAVLLAEQAGLALGSSPVDRHQ